MYRVQGLEPASALRRVELGWDSVRSSCKSRGAAWADELLVSGRDGENEGESRVPPGKGNDVRTNLWSSRASVSILVLLGFLVCKL